MKQQSTIALFGINGTYNFGCEAIVRGTFCISKKHFPSCKIKYYSFYYDYDKKILKDLDIDIIRLSRNRSILIRLLNKIALCLRLNKRFLTYDYKRIINGSDIIYSIGGDIYTIPSYKLKFQKYDYYNPLVDFFSRAGKSGAKIFIFGGSLGPFGTYPKAIEYFKKNLQAYSMIICRENDTIEYLRSIGVTNTRFYPDPAFFVHKDIQPPDSCHYIGINFSPLFIHEQTGKCGHEAIPRLAGIINTLHKRTNRGILLLPHVLSPDPNDNDLLFLQKIFGELDDDTRKSTRFADSGHGFLGIKNEIHKCDLVVSARMHCAINSIVEGVPTIFVSYSQKSYGICRYVYGDLKWITGFDEIEKNLPPLVDDILSQHDIIATHLKSRLGEIMSQYGCVPPHETASDF